MLFHFNMRQKKDSMIGPRIQRVSQNTDVFKDFIIIGQQGKR